MNPSTLTEAAALRIGLAARALPDTDPARLMKVLVNTFGLPLNEEKLARITVRELQSAGDGAFSAVPLPAMKAALDFLWGKADVRVDEQLPPVMAYASGDMPGSIRVAVASNSDEQVDGHFGSCTRFLVYQVAPNEMRLIDIRTPANVGGADDKNTHRAALLRDCDVLYVVSIGGPAAAKVVKQNIHPVKLPNGGPARDALAQMQSVLEANPPPWLARVMGRDGALAERFAVPADEE